MRCPNARIARLLAGLLLIGLFARAGAQPVAVPDPGDRDACPVCGMFVARYPEWVATVVYRDGHAHHFDGAKDLFKFLLDLGRWAPGHRADDIATIAVTDYYQVQRIDARSAWYVTGSDMLGPMGHELIPHATEAEARDFLRDHRGTRVLRHGEVTPELLRRLDEGRFD